MDNPTRRYPRVNKLCLIAYVNRDGEQQRTPVSLGRVLDISPAGIGMELFAEVQTGSVMEMEIDLQERLVAVQGKVVHVRPAPDGRYVVGIEFATPREELAGVVTSG
jgi:hypothetical protein